MAVQDKIADEMLTDEELDGVAGGTWDEWQEIKEFFLYESCKKGLGSGSYKTYRSEEWIKDWLKRNLNIEAEFDYYKILCFTGGSPNTYTRNGESLTHEQVVKEIRAIRG